MLDHVEIREIRIILFHIAGVPIRISFIKGSPCGVVVKCWRVESAGELKASSKFSCAITSTLRLIHLGKTQPTYSLPLTIGSIVTLLFLYVDDFCIK